MEISFRCQRLCSGAGQGSAGGQACVWQRRNQRCRVRLSFTLRICLLPITRELIISISCQSFDQLLNCVLPGECWGLVCPSCQWSKGLSCRGQRNMQWRYKNKIHNPVTNNHHNSQYLQVSIKLVLMKQTMAHQQQQTKYLQRQQAVSIMSRCCRIFPWKKLQR